MNIPQYLSDRRDPVIIFHRQACTCLFRIDPHTPEFQYSEHPSVLRESLLGIQDRSAIVTLHKQCDQNKQRRKADQHQERDHDVKNTLDNLLFHRQSSVAEQKQRSIEHMHLLRTHDHYI